MRRGESVGGFPGFEPPDDDEKYRSKIKNESYTPEEMDGWMGEINNFLRQVANKNPNLKLEEIPRRQGLNQTQIDNFVEAIRDAHAAANGMKGYGMNAKTVETLESLMKVLEVSPW